MAAGLLLEDEASAAAASTAAAAAAAAGEAFVPAVDLSEHSANILPEERTRDLLNANELI